MSIKTYCNRLGWLILLLQLLGSSSSYAAQPATSCPDMPPEKVCATMRFGGSQNTVYLFGDITGVVTPGAAISNATYGAWCVDYNGDLEPPMSFCDLQLRYLNDPILASLAHVPASLKVPSIVSQINWILNNRDSIANSVSNRTAWSIEVESAIWYLTDAATDYLAYPVSQALLTAAASHTSYIPGPGELQAVLLDGGPAWNNVFQFSHFTGRLQWMILEVRCPLTPPLSCAVGPLAAQTVCSGGSAMFTASAIGGVAPFTFSWSGPGGFTSPAATINVSVAGTYIVVIQDAAGQTSTCQAVLTVRDPLSVTVNSLEICLGDSAGATLVASTTTPGVAYLWSNGSTSPSITVYPTDKTVYSVTITKDGCSASNQGTVFVNQPPTVTLAPISICPGSPVDLVPDYSPNVVSFAWSDGSSDNHLMVTPLVPTVYSVTVTSDKGCKATASVTVGFNELPTVTLAGATICEGGSVNLTPVHSANVATYVWSTGDTTESITDSPVATRSYTVTVYTANGCSASATATVTVNPMPTASVNSTVICLGDSATLTATTDAVGATYVWSNGATTPSITVAPSVDTTYTVTVTSAAGCSTDAKGTVKIGSCICVVKADADQYGNAGGAGHAIYIPGIGTDFVFPYPAKLIDNGDGTARLVGTAVSKTDATKIWVVDVTLTGYTTVADIAGGSPKKELASNAYKPVGPIDPTTWAYYTHFSGTLTGQGIYTGAVLNIVDFMQHFQVGVGANGKNANYGASGWFSITSFTQPTGGRPAINPTGHGDFNVDLVDCGLCVTKAVSDLTYGQYGGGHAIYLPGIGTDFVFEPTAGKFIENADGTASIIGVVRSVSDNSKQFNVNIQLTGRTTVAPAGSPKKELKSTAYSPVGPINPATWTYYTGFTGTLTGAGSLSGGLLTFIRTGPAFQVGMGANGKNLNFGGSGWFLWTVVSSPAGSTWANGQGDVNVDLGLCNNPVKGSISGKVVCSDNNTALPGVLVTLKNAANAVVATKTTDASGKYKFDNLDSGAYTVCVPATSGGLAVSGASSKPVTIVSGGTGTADFAYKGGLISGYVFCDADGNCIKSAGDDAVSGIKVYLKDGCTTIATATTDANGYYEFKGCLPAGCYTVKVSSCYNGQSICTSNPLKVNLAAGQQSLNNNFGYKCKCVYTCAYWKCHTCEWPTCSLTIGGKCYSKCQIVSILSCTQNTDKSYAMFCQVVACKLNILNGCKSSTIADTLTAGDNWIKKYGVGKCIKVGSAAWNEGSAICAKLESYNNGGQGAPKCN